MKAILIFNAIFFLSHFCNAQIEDKNCYSIKEGYIVQIHKTFKGSMISTGDTWFFEEYPSFLEKVENPLDTLFDLGGKVVYNIYYVTKSSMINLSKVNDSAYAEQLYDLYSKYYDNYTDFRNKKGDFNYSIVPVKIFYFTKNKTLDQYFQLSRTSHSKSFLHGTLRIGNIELIYPELILYYPREELNTKKKKK